MATIKERKLEDIKAELARARRNKATALDAQDFEQAADLNDDIRRLETELFERRVEVEIKFGATSLRIRSNLRLPEPDLADFHGHHEWLSPSEVVVHYEPAKPYYETVERARCWLLEVAWKADVELALKL